MATASISPIHADNRPDRSFAYRGGRMTIHADAKETNGAFALIESEGAPGMEPPLHVHEREDEMVYVLEGSLLVTRGSEQHFLQAGDSCFLPRGVPHTFQILTPRARALGYITPAGFEEFFKAMAAHSEEPGLAQLISLCEKFGVQMMR